jgi:plastocyanin
MPTTIDVKTGDIVRVVDVGGTEHNLTIDASGKVPSSVAAKSDQLVINVDLLNRAAQAAIDLPPGTYTFYCSIDFGSGAGHTALNGTGMVGTLTVH